MEKRVAEWPPRAAAQEKRKKEEATNSSIPELSSLLSSESLPPDLLLLAKRHSPSAAYLDHHHHVVKRPRYHRAMEMMQGLEICCQTHKDEQDNTRLQPSWSSFLPELLQSICCRLSLADVPRFGAVCKHWNLCAFPVYPADATPVLISTALTHTGLIRCYSPFLNKMFVLTTPIRAPESRIFSTAANGWVMLRTPNKTVLFANLLDGSTSETPECQHDYGFMCAPHDDHHLHPKDRHIFCVGAHISTVKIQSWDGESWRNFEEEHGDDDDDEDEDDLEGDGHTRLFTMSSCCSPVVHKGLLYCLGEEGNLGVYDPTEIKWRLLPEPGSFGSEFPYNKCYLVESQGELLAVLTGKNGTPIHVLMLNETEMVWEKMESLGGRALFTGTARSLSMAKPPQTMANKVYLPRFYGRPQVIEAELTNSGGRLFFVAKAKQQGSSDEAGDGDGAWCYDLELDSARVGKPFKNLLQYVWVHLGLASETSGDAMDIG